MNLFVVFLTGLTTGGLSCLAVQGGFLASIITAQKNKELQHPTRDTVPGSLDKKDWQPVALFLLAKLISHTILGFGLGLVGSALTLTDSARLTFQAFTAVFMFATAMNLLDVHPIFRYVVLQPPRFITRRIRGLSKDDSRFAPFFLGLFTVFIPCGVTQAMEVNAIAVGNPIQSALLMFAFVLGTVPLFGLIGVMMAKLSEGLTKRFLKFAAFLLIGMSLYSINGVLEVIDSPVTLSKIQSGWVEFWTPDPVKKQQAPSIAVNDGKQLVTIDILRTGYSPQYVRVRRNIPVELTLRSNGVYSCALDFRLSAFGVKEFLEANDRKTVTFLPKEPGRYQFNCSMGMYTGVLEVL